MNTTDFQTFLLKSAIAMMACDSSIDDEEIAEIEKMINNEIYFMGFDYKKPFEDILKYIKSKGNIAINDYLDELSLLDLNEKQEIRLIEVLIRTIESDKKVENNEIKFLQRVKSKLGIKTERIISLFPKQISYLIDLDSYELTGKFMNEINFLQRD